MQLIYSSVRVLIYAIPQIQLNLISDKGEARQTNNIFSQPRLRSAVLMANGMPTLAWSMDST